MRRSCLLWLAFLPVACSHGGPTAPTQSVNREPTVTVLFQAASACAPGPARGVSPATPCTLTVVAQATDPDGDALTYNWSGCAAGTAPTALCTVTQPGQVTASVEVSDGHAHTVTASAVGEGTNHPPVVYLSGFFRPGNATSTLKAYGSIYDPEEGDLCGGGLFGPCPYLQSITVSGDCLTNRYGFVCGCMAGVEFDVFSTASSGTCSASISVKDSWGLVGTSTFTIPYGQATTGAPTTSGLGFRPP